MKTDISIPDDLFESAESLAALLGMSRSELYAIAVAEFLAKHAGAQVTAQLDAVYGAEASRLDSRLARAQRRSVAERPPSDEW